MSPVLGTFFILSLIIPSPVFSVVSFWNSYFLDVGLPGFICQLKFSPLFPIYPFIYFLRYFLNIILQPLKFPAVPILWIGHHLSPPWGFKGFLEVFSAPFPISNVSGLLFFLVSVFHISSIPDMAVPCKSQVWKCWCALWWVCFVTIGYIWGLAT